MVIGPKLKIYGVVLGIFVLGAGAGGAAGFAVAKRELAEVLREDRPGLGDARRFEAMSRELDLTREQRKKVRAIMEHHRDENRDLTKAMLEKCGEDMQGLRERVDQEIGGVLTPEQQRRFKELVENRGKRFPLGGPGPRRRKGD
jgi:Spy/CpxP family protein refolding chaperone